MAAFDYRASDNAGAVHKGVESAPDEQAAARALRARGLTPVKLVPRSGSGGSGVLADRARASTGSSPLKWLSRGSRAAVGSNDVLRLTSELSVLLQAGLPLDRALKVQLDTVPEGPFRSLVQDILTTIKGGKSLTMALEAYPDVFTHFYISMVRSGEASGNVGEVLSELADYLTRSKAVRATIVSAMVYPAILLVVAAISVAVMLGFVVPEFESLFEEMGDALPLLTSAIIGLGDLVSNWWWLILLVVLLGFSVLRNWLITEAGKQWLDTNLLRAPLAGPVLGKFEVSRFARTMGTLLSNGVAILKAAEIAQATVSNAVISSHLAELGPALKRGERLSRAMSSSVFSPMAIQMVLVGEESGKLDAMLIELAQVYEADVESDVKRALTLLEPALILFMGGVIALIIMGILMGILSVNTMAF